MELTFTKHLTTLDTPLQDLIFNTELLEEFQPEDYLYLDLL